MREENFNENKKNSAKWLGRSQGVKPWLGKSQNYLRRKKKHTHKYITSKGGIFNGCLCKNCYSII